MKNLKLLVLHIIKLFNNVPVRNSDKTIRPFKPKEIETIAIVSFLFIIIIITYVLVFGINHDVPN